MEVAQNLGSAFGAASEDASVATGKGSESTLATTTSMATSTTTTTPSTPSGCSQWPTKAVVQESVGPGISMTTTTTTCTFTPLVPDHAIASVSPTPFTCIDNNDCTTSSTGSGPCVNPAPLPHAQPVPCPSTPFTAMDKAPRRQDQDQVTAGKGRDATAAVTVAEKKTRSPSSTDVNCAPPPPPPGELSRWTVESNGRRAALVKGDGDRVTPPQPFGANTLPCSDWIDTKAASLNVSPLLSLQRRQRREQIIQRVLQQDSIIKLTRRLRTRLEYAILKIRRGWSKYTLQEMESLSQPGYYSPRLIATASSHSSSSSTSTSNSSYSSSTRQSDRKRTKRAFPDYHDHTARLRRPYQRRNVSSTDDEDLELGHERDHDGNILPMSLLPPPPTPPPPSSGQPQRRYWTRSSFSQFKDSELYSPAKSLMRIASSSLSHPHGASSYGEGTDAQKSTTLPSLTETDGLSDETLGQTIHHRVNDCDNGGVDAGEDEETASERQAARMILMLASSSPPRSVQSHSHRDPPPPSMHSSNQHQHYDRNPASDTSECHPDRVQHSILAPPLSLPQSSASFLSAAMPYSPMNSSPLVHFQVTAASTPSPSTAASLIEHRQHETLPQSPLLEGASSSSSSSSAVRRVPIQGSNSISPYSIHHHTAASPTRRPSSPLPNSRARLGQDHECNSRPGQQEMTPPRRRGRGRPRRTASTPPRSTRSTEMNTWTASTSPPPPSPSPTLQPSPSSTLFGAAGIGGKSLRDTAMRRRSSGLAGGSGVEIVRMFS